MFFPVEEWLPAFLLTLAVEEAVVLGVLARVAPSLPRLAVLVLVANLATHAVVWFVLTQVLLVGTPEYIVVAETWAVALEAACYWAALPGVSGSRILGAALAANAASYTIGLLAGAVLPVVTNATT